MGRKIPRNRLKSSVRFLISREEGPCAADGKVYIVASSETGYQRPPIEASHSNISPFKFPLSLFSTA